MARCRPSAGLHVWGRKNVGSRCKCGARTFEERLNRG